MKALHLQAASGAISRQELEAGAYFANRAESGCCCSYVAELQSNAASSMSWDVLFYGDSIMESWRCASMAVASAAHRVDVCQATLTVSPSDARKNEAAAGACIQTLLPSPALCALRCVTDAHRHEVHAEACSVAITPAADVHPTPGIDLPANARQSRSVSMLSQALQLLLQGDLPGDALGPLSKSVANLGREL